MTFKHTFDWKLLYIANNSNMKLKPVIMTLKIQMYIAESCFWSARLNFLATAKSSGDLSCLISARGWLSCRFNVLYCGLYRNTYILWLLPLALTFPNLELYILLKIQKNIFPRGNWSLLPTKESYKTHSNRLITRSQLRKWEGSSKVISRTKLLNLPMKQ